MRLLGTLAALAATTTALTALTALSAPAGVTAPADRHPGPPPAPALTWHETVVDAGQGFRGLDAVDARVAWVTGGSTTGGAGRVHRTDDGGRTWTDVTPPGTAGLSLRDVEASDARTALVLAIGPGEDSRIFRTTDAGATWVETFRNDDERAFYNCLDLYPDGRHGLAVSDPVDGRFRVLRTADAGRSWQVLPATGMPDATGEANFSASGDCLVIEGRDAFFGSGGAAARVFRSSDRGLTWEATPSGLPTGDAAGVFALAFRTPKHGVAVGGDFADPADGTDATASSRPGRRGSVAWTGGGDLTHLGEDAAFVPGTPRTVLTVGQGPDADGVLVEGTSLSRDGGRTWHRVSDTGFHTLDCPVRGTCWAAGAGGVVGRATVR